MSTSAPNGVTIGGSKQSSVHGSHAAGPAATSQFSGVYQTAMQAYAGGATPLKLAPTSGGLEGVAGHRMSDAATAVRHIPLRGVQGHDADDHIHERALRIRAYRMGLLASNIANADTPGYKARDIDVAQALREGAATVADIPIKYVASRQPSLDGNTVEMDTERSKFAENAIMYQFSLDRVIGHYRHMIELFQSLKD